MIIVNESKQKFQVTFKEEECIQGFNSIIRKFSFEIKSFKAKMDNTKEKKTQEVVKSRTPLYKTLPKRIPVIKLNNGKKSIVISMLL